jgi:2-polyprenyl-6-methoxyphenol hydroxylase-like FAD-dependent oxidoreductase
VKNSEVLISGAGIAGPALAYWLRRYGFAPTVVERAPAPREGGYKVDVRGAATGVLERMGLLDEARRASTGMRGVSFVDRANRPLATVGADFLMAREGDDVEIMRGDLGRLLYEATRGDTEYRFDDSITALAQDDAGVRVTFGRGRPRSFDLVVGADGLHSAVRALAFDAGAQRLRHLGLYLAIFSTANHLGLDRWELFYNAPGLLANLYSTGPQREAKALLAFASEPLRYDRRDVRRQKRLLADAFAGQAWEIPRLLQSMWEAPDFYFDAMSQVRLDAWSSGRAVLVGDAGYSPSPASGQGSSLALVGAYVLAGELAAAGGEHRRGFARYEAEMRGYVEQNLRLGQKMAREMVPGSRGELWLRTGMLRLLPYLPWKGLIADGTLRPLRQAASAITLKDYQGDPVAASADRPLTAVATPLLVAHTGAAGAPACAKTTPPAPSPACPSAGRTARCRCCGP